MSHYFITVKLVDCPKYDIAGKVKKTIDMRNHIVFKTYEVLVNMRGTP